MNIKNPSSSYAVISSTLKSAKIVEFSIFNSVLFANCASLKSLTIFVAFPSLASNTDWIFAPFSASSSPAAVSSSVISVLLFVSSVSILFWFAWVSIPSTMKYNSSVPKAVSINEESINCFCPSFKTIISFPESWISIWADDELLLSP